MINLGFHSGRNMPSVYIKPALVDYILDGLSISFTISVWILTLVSFWKLPDQSHEFPLNQILLLICTAICLWAARAPIRYYNFPVKLTEKNCVMQLFLARRCVRAINVAINIMFLFLLFDDLEGLFNIQTELFAIISYVLSFLILIILAVYYIFAFRFK